jgi:uncharacterized protein (PEP-CTERM system associated)
VLSGARVAASFAIAAAVGSAQAQVYGPAVPPAPPPGDTAQQEQQQPPPRRQTQTQRRPLTFSPSVAVEETFTDNVDLKPSSDKRSDAVTRITPAVAIDERGARTSLTGSVAMDALVHARTGGENDRIVPHVNLLGTVEAIERFFFVDASVFVSHDYFSPFGGRPASLVNLTQNELRTQNYRVSPYIKGASGDIDYELRDNSIWNRVSSAPASVDNSYTNEIVGHVAGTPRPFGWAVEYSRSQVEFQNQPEKYLTELGRARAVYRPRTQFELSAGVGYERNRYPLARFDDFIYNVATRWRPTERTGLDAFWEHRFFGSSYRLSFDHRTPLTVWRANASRDVTSYPQQLAQFGPGSIVPALLDSLFASAIPDPQARTRYVIEFMRDRGLPLVLTSPYTIYNQQVYLEQRASATAGVFGSRNSLFFTGYHVRTEPVTAAGSDLPPVFLLTNNNTQVGGGVSWTYRLTAAALLGASADYVRTTALAPLEGRTEQTTLRASVTSPVSTRTAVTAGARWQDFRSDISESWREIAAFVGLTYSFR